MRAVVYVDLVGVDESEARRRLLAGVAGGRAKPSVVPGYPETAPTAAVPPVPVEVARGVDVPARNPNFSGRDAELDGLRATLAAAGVGGTGEVAVLAVSGLGGVGKTQLAVEHAWRWAARYDLVWWVPADTPAAVPGALAALADRLGLPVDDPVMLVGVYEELSRRERWLLVFNSGEDLGSRCHGGGSPTP